MDSGANNSVAVRVRNEIIAYLRTIKYTNGGLVFNVVRESKTETPIKPSSEECPCAVVTINPNIKGDSPTNKSYFRVLDKYFFISINIYLHLLESGVDIEAKLLNISEYVLSKFYSPDDGNAGFTPSFEWYINQEGRTSTEESSTRWLNGEVDEPVLPPFYGIRVKLPIECCMV